MPSRKPTYRLKPYRELKMSGMFSAETVEELIDTATSLTLGKIRPNHLPIVPVDEVRLYDISHIDTGNRRPINKRGDTVRIYQSTMHEVTTRPLRAARFALESIALDGLGASHAVKASIEGRLKADLDDQSIRDVYNHGDIEAIRHTLGEQKFTPYILGTLVAGSSFTFGEARFNQPPNENYDGLIELGSFHDERYLVPQK